LAGRARARIQQIDQSGPAGEKGMIKMRGEAIQNRDDIAKVPAVGIAKLGIHFSG
jgi:hypothetical protein